MSDRSCTLVFQTLIESSASHSFTVLFILFTPCSLCPPNSSLAMVKEWQERMIKTSSSFYPCPSLCIVCLSFCLTVYFFLSLSWQALASEWIKFSSLLLHVTPFILQTVYNSQLDDKKWMQIIIYSFCKLKSIHFSSLLFSSLLFSSLLFSLLFSSLLFSSLLFSSLLFSFFLSFFFLYFFLSICW